MNLPNLETTLKSTTDLHNRRQIASEASMGISTNAIYDKFEAHLRKLELTGSILDFGAGSGNFVLRLLEMERFSTITGVDLMDRPENLTTTIKWAAADLNFPTSFTDETFDVIVSPEVIEHLENPRAICREWFRLLKPGGTLIFSTPNNESYRAIMALIFQGHFVAFGDNCYPAHITALVRQDLTRILNETGFLAPDYVFTDHGSIPKFPKYKWHQISLGLLKGNRFSDNILAITQKPVKM